MTGKQAAFVREYLIDLNATQAAIRAGYSEKTAGAVGFENLRKPKIARAIQAALGKRAERTEVTADRVLTELARIAFADLRDLFTWDEERACFVPSRDLTEDQAAAISSIKAKTTRIPRENGDDLEEIRLELKTYDKVAALREIGKHLGIAEKLDLSGSVDVKVSDARDRITRELAGIAARRRAAADPASGNGRRS